MAVDAQLVGSAGNSTTTTLTSVAGSSAGLTKFLIAVRVFFNNASDPMGTVSDSVGNTYTQIGSTGYFAGNFDAIAFYLCESGTGNASHTATMTFSAAPFGAEIALIAVTGAAATALDAHNLGTTTGSAPGASIAVTTGVLAQAAEVLVSMGMWDTDGTNVTGWSSTLQSILESQTGAGGGAGVPTCGATGKLVVASTSSISIDLIPSGVSAGTHDGGIFFASFKQAAASGAMTGTTALTFAQTGSLKGTGAMIASGALIFGQTGALTGKGALAGTGAVVFNQVGALTGAGALAGSNAITFGQTGAIAGTGALAGSNSITFGGSGTLTPPSGALTGTGAITFGQTGSLTGVGALAGTAAITFNQTGIINGAGAAAGTAAITFGASGTLIPPGAMQGTGAMTFGQTGTMAGTAAMSGEADFFFTASGTMIQPALLTTATPGRTLRHMRAQIKGETEAQKYARRIEQGIIVEALERIEAPLPVDRTIERLTAQIVATRAQAAAYRASADRAQNRAKAQAAEAKLIRLDRQLADAQTKLIQAQTEEHDIVFVASVLANL